MFPIFQHAHSGLRWLVLLGLVAAVINAFTKWRKGVVASERDRKLGFFAMMFVHIQLLLGLALYLISEKVIFSTESMSVAMNRFFLVEHPSMMVLAIILITVGYSRAKKATTDAAYFRRLFWFYAIGLVLILLGIPWPHQGYGTGWF